MDKKLREICVVSFIALKSVGPTRTIICSISKKLVQSNKNVKFVQKVGSIFCVI